MNIFDTITNPITEYIFDTSALYLQIKNSIETKRNETKSWAKTKENILRWRNFKCQYQKCSETREMRQKLITKIQWTTHFSFHHVVLMRDCNHSIRSALLFFIFSRNLYDNFIYSLQWYESKPTHRTAKNTITIFYGRFFKTNTFFR